jgi:hypothetical protein
MIITAGKQYQTVIMDLLDQHNAKIAITFSSGDIQTIENFLYFPHYN